MSLDVQNAQNDNKRKNYGRHTNPIREESNVGEAVSFSLSPVIVCMESSEISVSKLTEEGSATNSHGDGEA